MEIAEACFGVDPLCISACPEDCLHCDWHTGSTAQEDILIKPSECSDCRGCIVACSAPAFWW